MITAVGSCNDAASALVHQPDGKLVAAERSASGSDFDFALVRCY
ncbi:hypothetical protein [Meiothermus sp. CFH 77666]|nr:hypothetical protein [Meiothermus sp. CFH 77666]